MTDSAPAPRPAAQRLAGLDLLRGIAVAGMIVVNTPGSWSHVWWPLDHAEWFGWTPTDLVFPTFLFAMGVALGLSFPRGLDAADRRRLWGRIVWRSLALIGLGLLVAIIVKIVFSGRPDFATLRFPGVLQRIGITYALAAALAILTARREGDGRAHLNLAVLGGVIALLLVGYWAALSFVPVPGFGAGRLDPDGNLAAWLDRAILTTAHMYSEGKGAAGTVAYDPEGLVSTLPALANVLIGMIVAAVWKSKGDRAVPSIAIAGLVLLVAGLLLHPLFPISKKLWTSSFVLLTSGAAILLLVGCMAAAHSRIATRMLSPFLVFGMNAILAYLLSDAISILLDAVRIGGRSLHDIGYAALLGIFPDPYVASHLYALAVLAVIFAMVAPLHRRGIHLRL